MRLRRDRMGTASDARRSLGERGDVSTEPKPISWRLPFCWTRSTHDLPPVGLTSMLRPSPSRWRPGLADLTEAAVSLPNGVPRFVTTL